MSDDFLYKSAAKQYQVLQAGRDEAVANISNARRYGDEDTAAENIQYLANIDSQIRDLTDLCNRHVASQTPAPPATDQEILAKPLDQMNHNEWYRYLNKTTKHGLDEAGYREGIAEVARRRARGQ
jgi:transcription elongation GreA/GreB family factor